MLGKEGVGPATVIETTATSATVVAPTQNATQSHANPRVQRWKRGSVTMLEVVKPSLQSPIDVRDDDRQATTIVPLRFRAERVLKVPETFPTRPAIAALEVIPQKIKSSRLRRVHDACLLRMQRQSGFRRPLLHRVQRPHRFGLASTQNYEVSRPGEFHPEPLAEPYLNVSAHTAPAMEPRRTPIVQWANNFGARREIRAIQCAARRL